MPGLKERFIDGVKAPVHEVVRLGHPEFLDLANDVFNFGESEVLSSVLSLGGRFMEMRLDYWVLAGSAMKWRELRVRFAGVDAIHFGHQDGTLGFPHRTVVRVDLDYAVRNQVSLLPTIDRTLWRDHTGAELNSISFEKEASQLDKVLGVTQPADVATVWLDWDLPRDPARILVDKVVCREVELEFLTEASNRPGVTIRPVLS